jgi:hypothetical protein
MALCDNAFCTVEIVGFEYIATAGRKFCCIACAENWRRQNEALINAAEPFHTPPREHGANPARPAIAEGGRWKAF